MIRLAAALLLFAAPLAAQDLAHRTAAVEDLRSIREIKRLQAEWGYLEMAGDWQAMSALETGGVRTGHEGTVPGIPAGKLNLHIYYSPVVTLGPDGQRATVRWRELALTGEAGVSADWQGNTVQVGYRKTPDGWRIASWQSWMQFAGPYATGFTHDADTLVRAPYHYTADEVGTLLTGRAAATPRSEAEIDAEATLLYALGRAENLVNAFGFYLDRKMYDDIVDLFAPAATIDVAGQGTYSGPGGVRKFLARFGAPGLSEGELNDRPQLMPEVSTSSDGASALVRTVELGMTGHLRGEGYWSAAVNTFLLTRNAAGRWQISMLHRRPLMRATYREGWAHPLPAALPVDAAGAAEGPPQPVDTSYPEHPFAMQQLGSGVVFAPRGEPRDMKVLSNALGRAEAFDAAENLADAYGGYIDELSYPNMAQLFAEDGWREQPNIGIIAGREKILEAATMRYGNRSGAPSNAFVPLHGLTQPYVSPIGDGTRAQARMRLMQWNTSAAGGAQGGWLAGVYEWQVKKNGTVWKLAGMDLDYTWLANYKDGWTGVKPGEGAAISASPQLLARYHVDAPLRGMSGFPFPRIETLGFHYPNPVSDREPARQIEWMEVAPAE